MTTKERTLRFIAYKGLSIKKFEEICGLSNGYLNSMRSGYGKGKLEQVLYAFPELNRDWLVYGEGEMIKEVIVEPVNNVSAQQEVLNETSQPQYEILIAELRAKIEKLEGKVDQLNQELGEKNALLKLMRQESIEPAKI